MTERGAYNLDVEAGGMIKTKPDSRGGVVPPVARNAGSGLAAVVEL